jgi:GNAT superfamily N-acetyltransferase
MWLLPDPATRLGRLNRMFATIIGIESLPFGGVDMACASQEILGGAIWMPPGRWQPGLLGKIRAAPRHWRAVATAEIRAARLGHALSRDHPEEPHWYLKSIGIDPSCQGRGAAGVLLRSRLEQCDRKGQPAYLEASKPEGVPLYERFGFRPAGNVRMPAGAPPLTKMWRSPGTVRAGSGRRAGARDEAGRLVDRSVSGREEVGLQGEVMP